MAFQVPSLSDVSRTIENGFSSAFYGKSGSLRVGVQKVLAKVIAGGCYLPILFCQYIFRNSFIDTCDVENLVRFGGWYNLPHKVASPARGKVKITSTQVITIPEGSVLVDEDTDDEFETLEAFVANSSAEHTEYIKVIAVNVGAEGNRSEWDKKSLKLRDIEAQNVTIETNSIGGGSSVDVSVNGIVEHWGESVEDYRSRLKFRRQHQPMGGSIADYKQWAEKFSQVTDAFVFGNFPLTNSVSIFCADYNSNISLNDDELEEVENYICDESRKPITADVNVRSVTPLTLALTIKIPSLTGGKTQEVIDTLTKFFKGFGMGDTITKALVEKALVENGVCNSCEVTKIKVDGNDVTSTGYTFKLSAEDGVVVGEVVNTKRIEELLSLVAE